MQRSRQEHKQGTQNAHDINDVVKQVTNFPNYRSERVYIYSNDKQDGTYSAAQYVNSNSIIKRGVSGIGLEECHINYCITNINERNNSIDFIYGGVPHKVNLPIKNYETITDLFTAIVAIMESAVAGVDPFTFTINDDCTVDFETDAQFQFNNCSFINFGESVHGLYYTSTTVTKFKTVPHLQYTSFIDIAITDITNSQLAQSTYGKQQRFNTIAHIGRVHVDDVIKIPRKIVKKYDSKINYFPYRHRSLNSLAITLYDEYNNSLFTKVFESTSGETIELQNLKYSIILNTVF